MIHVTICIKALSVQNEETRMHKTEMRAVIQLFFVLFQTSW